MDKVQIKQNSMNCLLIGGAQSVGKSETIYRLANALTLRGFRVTSGSIPITFTDFRCVLEGSDKKNNTIRIIINSPSDTVPIIQEFKIFYDINGLYDIMISSVRDNNFYPRRDFFNIMDINPVRNFILEVPLGKITRRGANFFTALNWYENQTDNLLNHILNNPPYNI